MIGSHIVSEGHRAALWDNSGRRTIVIGPRRIMLWGRRHRVEPLRQFVAGPTQYLVIRHNDGRVEHRRGPAVAWMDPVEHSAIEVADAVALDANEALVVYRQAADKVERRVVRGPEMFVPESQEWLHSFRWHGADPNNPTRKVPRALNFTKLRVIPDQTYFDVVNVRTADDAVLIVRLMIFYELIDIDVMLDQTHDPIADFINAVTADVIDFAATLKFEQLKEQTDRLSARETYSQLAQRAGRIGYRINKVVYRGYEATAKLQAMHDGAIETRTRLKLEAETETKAQELADMKLRRENERTRQKQEMERHEIEHQARLKRIAHDEEMRQKQVERDAQMKGQEILNAQRLCMRQKRSGLALHHGQQAYAQRMEFLRSIHALQVDLTRYLVARHERPDRRIQLDGNQRPHLHLQTS